MTVKSAILLLKNCPKEQFKNSLLVSGLLIMSEKWKQSTCLITEECLNKSWYAHWKLKKTAMPLKTKLLKNIKL